MLSDAFKPGSCWVWIRGYKYEGWLPDDYETDMRLFASQDAAHDYDKAFKATHDKNHYTEIFKASVFWDAEQALRDDDGSSDDDDDDDDC